jgi:hypothetical protein
MPKLLPKPFLPARASLDELMIPEALAFRNSLRVDEQETFGELYLPAYPNIKLMKDLVDYVIPLGKYFLR